MNAESPNLDLGVIGNCYLAAPIDRAGLIVWCCYPRLDGDPLFCNLLGGSAGNGADAGGFLDREEEHQARSSQGYIGHTAILETVLSDAEGQSVRVTDFAPRFRQFERIYRPPMLIRRIEPMNGSARIRIRIRPRAANGAVTPSAVPGSNHIRYLAAGSAVRVTTDAPGTYIAEDYWIEWVRYLSVPFEWQDAVIRAAIALKLCNFEETGGIVAALTTSIPEAPNSPRHWEYRYCWLRDAYFVVHALTRLNATRTMEDFIRYITNVAATEVDGNLKPVYRIVPGENLPESVVPDLPGYRGMGPVRIGNLAETQTQNDVYGSVVLAAAQMFFDRRLRHPGDAGLFRRLEAVGAKAISVAFKPDAGLCEYRGGNFLAVHTHSSVMCWAACDRLARIARVLDLADRRDFWRAESDPLRGEILERAWNP